MLKPKQSFFRTLDYRLVARQDWAFEKFGLFRIKYFTFSTSRAAAALSALTNCGMARNAAARNAGALAGETRAAARPPPSAAAT